MSNIVIGILISFDLILLYFGFVLYDEFEHKGKIELKAKSIVLFVNSIVYILLVILLYLNKNSLHYTWTFFAFPVSFLLSKLAYYFLCKYLLLKDKNQT